MARMKVETIIKDLISPFFLNKEQKLYIKDLNQRYEREFLAKCVDIAAKKYLKYDEKGQVIEESIQEFINKIGGIAYNKSRPPIEQEINHVNNAGKSAIADWNSKKADILLHDYATALESSFNWQEKTIVDDLRGDTLRYTKDSKNWSSWSKMIRAWIDYIYSNKEDNLTIKQSGTILPEGLFADLPANFCSMCKQINASYENNLYDCTAVIMRRLLEGLLVLSYQNAEIEDEIMDKEGKHHIPLDSMIKNASKNSKLALSSNTKKDMGIFKDLGNYSAHKIWYNCTHGDLEHKILKYRAIVEELFYKSGIKK